MFLIKQGEELTPLKIGKILNEFQTAELPKLKKWKNYYDGKQAVMRKTATDVGRPNNKIVVNYCFNIVNNYLGYLTGIPVAYDNDDFDEVKDVLLYNDVATEDSDLLKNALIYGKAYEINYIDLDNKQRFKVLDTQNIVPVYDNTLTNELMYVIRFWQEDVVEEQLNNYLVEVYSKNDIKKYRSNSGWSSFELLEETPHFYGQVPITVFSLNSDEVSIFDKIITLQDSYNTLLSSEVDDFEDFANAYLILKGLRGTDENDLSEMKKNRVLLLDPEDDAEWLTKSISDTQIANMLDNINNQIHKIANSPDFNDEKFMSQSGVAMRYKLVGFENASSTIEANMRKALQKRIELITSIISLANGEEVWRDVNIVFTRNLPLNLDPNNMSIQDLMSMKGTVSDRTLLSLLPFVKDVDEEMKELEKEQEKRMSLYDLGGNDDEEELVEDGRDNKETDASGQ